MKAFPPQSRALWKQFIDQLLRGGKKRRMRRRRRPWCAPLLERLEERTQPAAYTVTTLSDALVHTGLSLRDALGLANVDAHAGISDSIVFNPSFNGQTLPLVQGQLELGLGGTGAGTITIDASALPNGITISAHGASGVFLVDPGATAILNNLTITEGAANQGGGINTSGTLTLNACVISGNSAPNGGGGVYNTSVLTLNDSTISGNLAGGLRGSGGGIRNTGTLAVTDCMITNNVCSPVRNVIGVSYGGGIENNGQMSVTGSIFAYNYAMNGGAISNNYDSASIDHAYPGNITVATSTFDHNSAENGGAFCNLGILTLVSSSVYANDGSGGGAIWNEHTATAINTTFSANWTYDSAGSVIDDQNFSAPVTSTLINCTLSGNMSPAIEGGNLGNGVPVTNTLNNCIVAGNSGAWDFDIDGTVSPASANNLIGSAGGGYYSGLHGGLTGITNGVNGNQIGTAANPINPLLGTLGYHGGPTETMPLLPGSPAIDAGKNSAAVDGLGNPLATDQQGNPRVVNGTVDIGAYEVQNLLITSPSSATFTPGISGSLTITASGNAGTPSLSEFGALPNGLAFVDNNNGTATLSGTPAPGTQGPYILVLTAKDGVHPSAQQQFTLTVTQPPLSGAAGTILVTTLSDSAGHSGESLRDALAQANADTRVGISDTIYFDTSLNGQTIILRQGVLEVGQGGAGDGTITIDAATLANGISISGSDASSVFKVDFGAAASISDVTITNGSSSTYGGGVVNAGTLTLIDSAVTGNVSSNGGSAIDNRGTLSVTGSTFSNNTALGNSYYYGCIFNHGTASISNSLFNNNHGAGRGGIWNYGTLAVSNTVFSEAQNGACTDGITNRGDLTVADSTFTGLQASAAIVNTGHCAVTGSTFDHNTTYGAIGNNGILFIANSTFSGNTSNYSGGAINDDNGNLELVHCTISGNTSSRAGSGIYSRYGPVLLYNTIIAGNNGAVPDVRGPVLANSANNLIGVNAILSGGSGNYSSMSGITNGTNGNIVGTSSSPVSAMLAPLANNGGLTETMALLPGSPALGAGNVKFALDVSSNPLATDQRGSARVINGHVDIGAFEFLGVAITSAATSNFTAGDSASFTVTTVLTPSGQPTPALSESGRLPSGVAFHDNGNGTATLSGTPALSTGGVYKITIVASIGVNANVYQTFTLMVYGPPTITSPNNATFTVGTANIFTVTAVGLPAATFSESGALPSGIAWNSGTGVFSGTPAAGAGGVYILTVTASNGYSPIAQQTLTLTVDEAPTFTSSASTTFTVGSAGSFTVTTGHVYPAPPLLSENGSLPSGVSFQDNGDGTATISGTPAASTSAIYTFTLTASAGSLLTVQEVFTLTVFAPPSIVSANNTTFAVGTASSFTVTAVGLPASTYSEIGALPNGITWNASKGVISGTPASGSGGVYTLSIAASNGCNPNAQQTFTLTVDEATSLTSAASANVGVGSAVSFLVTTGHEYPLPTLVQAGTLPNGLAFHDNGDGTASISGTPAAGSGGSYILNLTARNGIGQGVQQTFTLFVYGPPVITSVNNAQFAVGTEGTFAVTTIGGFPATPTFSETGALPGGVTLNASTGVLSGTPVAGSGGIYAFTVTASNGAEPDSVQLFTLTVDEAPTFGSTTSTAFTVGAAGTFTIATGHEYPAMPTLLQAGTLPSGLTFQDNGDGTATISGTPAVGSGGSYTLVLTASNGILPNAQQTFILIVDEPPSIVSVNNATFTAATAGAFQVATKGFPAAAFSETGALPAGVTLNAQWGYFSGTPAVGTGGVYSIIVTASNGAKPDAQQSFTLTVNEAPTITSSAIAPFVIGSVGSFTVTTGHEYPAIPALLESGSLPSGLTFQDNGDGTATISGTPAAGTGGTYLLHLTANNGILPSAQQILTLAVGITPSIASAASVTFAVGSMGRFTVAAYGLPAPVLSESGALPGGVSFDPSTGVLSGTPAAGSGGVYSITFIAGNIINRDVPQTFTLTVDEAPALGSLPAPMFTVGTAGSFTFSTGRGYPVASLSASGALPSGLTFHDNGNGTATVAGAPAAGTGGTYTLTLNASNGIPGDAHQAFTITIDEAASITSSSAATFAAGSADLFEITTLGFPAAAVSVSGILPSGMAFNGSPGAGFLDGTPDAGSGGVYPLTLTATNGLGQRAQQSFTLTVIEAPVIAASPRATFFAGQHGSFAVLASGFPYPAITSTALPAGLTLTDNHNGSASIDGAPLSTAGGTYAVTLTATNPQGATATQVLTLVINEPPAFTSAGGADFTVGHAGSFSITTAAGWPAATTVSATGRLPAGVTFRQGPGGSATITGTPAAGSAGTYVLSLTASNGISAPVAQTFTLSVQQPAAFASAASATFVVGRSASITVVTSGFPYAVISATTLPAGLTFTDNHNGTATINGAAQAGGAGNHAITLTASNGAGAAAHQTFVLSVVQPPSFISASSTAFVVGRAAAFGIVARAGWPSATAITVAGKLPAGLTVKIGANGTAILSGAPAAGSGGAYVLTLTARNALAAVTQVFTLIVQQPVAFTSAAAATIARNAMENFTVTTRGFPYAAITSTTLPPGLTLIDNHNGTATIKGIPSVRGKYRFTITASNGIFAAVRETFVLTVV
jgi:hypothetical protein